MAGPLMAAPALRGRRRAGRPLVAEINVTPLVDVMLVLLVIVMVTAPLPMRPAVHVQAQNGRSSTMGSGVARSSSTMRRMECPKATASSARLWIGLHLGGVAGRPRARMARFVRGFGAPNLRSGWMWPASS
jgi:hypothetical protein